MRKKEGNKELDIIDASVRVFSSEGYSEAKIHKIADEAGIASGTVYLYFKNKEEILLRIFESVWKNLFERIDKVDKNECEPIRKVQLLIDNVFEFFNSDPALATVFVNEQHHIMKRDNTIVMNNYKKSIGICEKVVSEGIKMNVFKKETDSIIFSTLLFGGIRYLLQQWAQNREILSLEKSRENIKNFVLYGIVA